MKYAILLLTLLLSWGVLAAPPVAPSAQTLEFISLNDVPMKDAARLISNATGTHIVVSKNAANVKVDLHLQNVPPEVSLKSICQGAGLWFQKNKQENMFNVMTLEEFKDTLQFDRSEQVEVVQILYPSARDIGDALAKLYVDRVIWLNPRKNSGDRYYDITKALKRMDLLAKRGTFDITDNETETEDDDEDEDEDDNDQTKKTEAEKAQAVDLTRVSAANLRKMLQGVTKDDSLLKVNKLLNTPGVVFISVLPENNSLMLRSGDSHAIAEMLKVVKKLDQPIPQVLLEVKVLEVLLDDSKERALDFLFGSSNGKISGGFDNGSMTVGGGQDILKPTAWNKNTGAGLIQQGSGINSKAAIFNAVSKNFKARLQLLENDERVTELATPNLLVSNNESTTLFIGSETTVMEKAQSTTTYNNSNDTLVPVVSWEIDSPRRKIGTSLLLTPKIHADRTVTLRLLQEKSSLGQQTKNIYSGGTAAANTEEQYFISQDINLQRIVTTVVSQDRDFMVIGGLINEKVVKETEKVPGLANIPVLGELLFTRLKAGRRRSEILIVVRPFVMLAPGETQMVSQSYLERMSQHPAAREDLPSLGVNTPDELAKPKVINPNDPWLIKMFNQLRGWHVDDTSSFNVQEKFNRETRRKHHREALQELKKVEKNVQ